MGNPPLYVAYWGWGTPRKLTDPVPSSPLLLRVSHQARLLGSHILQISHEFATEPRAALNASQTLSHCSHTDGSRTTLFSPC